MTSINDPSVSKQPWVLGLRALGLQLDSEQIEACLWLGAELLVWNRRSNLTGITDPVEVQVKHLLDSLTLVPFLGRLLGERQGRLVDVGSGAGFPAFPVKLALPALDVTLVEATGKKVVFLRHIIEGLRLEGIVPISARSEALANDPAYRESFDVAVTRALGSVATSVELLLPLVRLGGSAVLMKTNAGLAQELESALPALKTLGGRVHEIVPTSIPGLLEDRALLVLEKIGPTPERYPRRPGLPERRPLIARARERALQAKAAGRNLVVGGDGPRP